MNPQPHRSDHVAYSTDEGEPRAYEYEYRWKLKALELIRTLATPESKPTVLDFGCGRGEFLHLLRDEQLECVGVDFDPQCVQLGSQFAPCHQASIERVGEVLQHRQFDVVSCLHVLEHLEHPRAAVEQLKSLSKRWLIFAVPNLATAERLSLRSMRPCNAGHCQGWDHAHFQNFLQNKCGLRIVRWQPDSVVAFHPLLSRAFERVGLRRWLEYRWLPRLLPYLSISLLVLCERQD